MYMTDSDLCWLCPPSELMVTMGFPKDEITESLHGQKYDDVMATYLLLGRKAPEVSTDILFTLSPAVNALTISVKPVSLYFSSRGVSLWLTAFWVSDSDRPVTSTTVPAFPLPIPRSHAASRPIRSSVATVIMVGMMMVVVVVVS